MAAAALVATGCTTLQQETTSFNPPAPGSTWQMSQHNTGSYGKDAESVMTRGEDTVYQGQKVYQMTSKTAGFTIMVTPDGKWPAIMAKNGKPLITFEPPIGYEYPLFAGKTWKTHHKTTNHATGKSGEFDYSCKVEGLESVTVKAGTFQAYKIECDNELSHDVSWFARDAGVNVKMDLERKAANPSGAGTQRAELVALDRK